MKEYYIIGEHKGIGKINLSSLIRQETSTSGVGVKNCRLIQTQLCFCSIIFYSIQTH